MLSEIGSEFWEADIADKNKLVFESNYQFLLSGRTSIDFVIKDIKANKKISTVYMPSYCCHTMIHPFIANGVDVKFYNVDLIDGIFSYDIDFNTQCDVVLIMQYFGYQNDNVEQIIDRFKIKGKIIIEDATHSWFSSKPYCLKSDYVIASFRKWTGIACGSIAIKRYSSFSIPVPVEQYKRYIETRQRAANLKKIYMKNGIGEKDVFLNLFNEAENMLEKNYQLYSIPDDIIDILNKLNCNKIREKRKKNAKYLTDELSKIENVKCISYSDNDTPLFVPILILDNNRNKLRQFLINNNIYCPVHWPLSNLHNIKNKSIYENGLSLVCDQRYNVDDMKRIITLINEFFGG